MTRQCALITLLLAGFLSPGAGAAEPPPAQLPSEEPLPLFMQLDTNKDGFVTREEARRSAEVTTRFAEMDTDRDGRISAAEFKKVMQPKM